MNDLKHALLTLGFKQLSTYLQSGNVVFEAESKNCKELEKSISKVIQNTFSFDIKVKVIEKEQFLSAFEENPFIGKSEIDTKQLYYIHLMGAPDLEMLKQLQSDHNIPEKMSLTGEVLYVHYVNGYGRSKIHGNGIERKLKVTATARNHNTMKHLAQMLEKLK